MRLKKPLRLSTKLIISMKNSLHEYLLPHITPTIPARLNRRALFHQKNTSMLNIKNFWDASLGIWQEIREIPDGFTLFAESGSSSYYKNEDETMVIRVSDHWGSGVRYCNWYLRGYQPANSYNWGKHCGRSITKKGIIKISELIDLRAKTPGFENE